MVTTWSWDAPELDPTRAVGAVFLFDGTTGAQIGTIPNPDPETVTGFGSALAAVGSNILIGSPNDDNGAGTAYLYAPPATPGGRRTLLTTFIQPDGGGGNFGASVAGTQDTALIARRGQSGYERCRGGVPVRCGPVESNLRQRDHGGAGGHADFGRRLRRGRRVRRWCARRRGGRAIGSSSPGAEAVDLYQPVHRSRFRPRRPMRRRRLTR